MILRITAPDGGRRADTWLAEALTEQGAACTRSGLKRLFDGGRITRSGAPVKPSYKAKPGECFVVDMPEPAPLDVAPENIPLDVAYEDECLIVVNKPQGMVVHPAPGHYGGTLVNALLHHCGGGLSGINGVQRPGIVHRIDRDTSGLLVAAKNDSAHRALAKQLAAREMTRRYDAVVCGRLDAAVTIDKPIARHHTERKKMAVVPGGRRAVTHVTPMRTLEKQGARNNVYTLVEARLETGRTHQIRVHMAYINRPLLGDPVYGGETGPQWLRGQALHAATLGFRHPVTGAYMEFTAAPPGYFAALLEKLG